MVHNRPNLSKAEKMCYLKQALIGDAEISLRDFLAQDQMYEEAWQYFCQQYTNPRVVIDDHFRNLMNLFLIKSEAGIRQLLDKVNVIVRDLKVCDQPIDTTFSRFLCHIVMTKLDKNTVRDWRLTLKAEDTADYPDYEKLEKFLVTRSFACEEGQHDLSLIHISEPTRPY